MTTIINGVRYRSDGVRAKVLPSLVGQSFERLTVLSEEEPQGRLRIWLCECACGNRILARTAPLRNGNTRSCGCLKREKARDRHIKHGLAGTPEHIIWKSMNSRCFNANEKCYPRYGGRGITVCDKWRSDFAAFLADIGTRPSPRHSLDRINNDGNYEPGNVRWATMPEQGRNTRRTRFVTLKGRTLPLIDAAMEVGIPYNRLRMRLNVVGGNNIDEVMLRPWRV